MSPTLPRFARRSTGVILACLLAVPSAARTQQPGANPPGPLPEAIDCAACHTAEAWTPTRRDPEFRHDEDTGFSLTGMHGGVDCAGCHLELRFDEPAIASSDCGACHADVHQGRMVEECAACHTPWSFQEVEGESVHMRTAFPLTGAHLQISCEACHTDDTGGAFTALETECLACHRDDYQSARTIDHVAAGFSDDCTACHSAVAWQDAPAFEHPTPVGEIATAGAHASLRCASCHAVPGYDLLFPAPASLDDCVACHRADYDREHGGTDFPTTCTDCHTPTSWDDAAFDHDERFFPIFSGAHRGQWSDCVTCHTTPGVFTAFTCFTCHQHNQADTDAHHREVQGYVYDSAECYACHTDGRR
ncbi:MAG TPA: hypothetical protein VLL48_07115 [Longimicrobiales bacterium]|nr:hypothetical protein [Longimicrobiales bacterium]